MMYYPGFSERVNDPEILRALGKNRKITRIVLLCILPIPVIGFLIYGKVTENMSLGMSLAAGCGISAFILLLTLISSMKSRASNSYDAVVENKTTRQVAQKNSEDKRGRSVYLTEYITTVRTDDGKRKQIVEREGSLIQAYGYLNIGDRFRYHPQFAFPYELYDKSRAPYFGCPVCGKHNPPQNDRCAKCGAALLK